MLTAMLLELKLTHFYIKASISSYRELSQLLGKSKIFYSSQSKTSQSFENYSLNFLRFSKIYNFVISFCFRRKWIKLKIIIIIVILRFFRWIRMVSILKGQHLSLRFNDAEFFKWHFGWRLTRQSRVIAIRYRGYVTFPYKGIRKICTSFYYN